MKSRVLKPFFILSIVFLLIVVIQSVSASISDAFKQQLQIAGNNPLIIGQHEIAVPQMLRNFYQYNDYQPVWNKAKINVLLKNIKQSSTLGLSPEDYLQTEITTRLKQKPMTEQRKAQLDILLTYSLIRLAYHLKFGKVVPSELDPDWNLRRAFTTADQIAVLHYALRSRDKLEKMLVKISNIGPFYQGLIKALACYRQIETEGGWQAIPSGQTIKPDMSDPRIPLIKARLQFSGDLPRTSINPTDQQYTQTLENAVKQYQQRHNLESDGVIGKGTLAQMNVPVEQRIDQIKANLERMRWVNDNLGDEFVVVNIAGFQVYYAKNNKITWHTRAQVGTSYRKTPVFRDEISYVEFNPTWTVPPTILRKDVLPKIKKDRSYLKKKNMNIIDRNGNIINPQSINWSSVSAGNFPYMIRQEPGPTNALGRVKIMFPNKHLVYLHDTPSKSKFDRAKRAFSSGCVRVQKPFELVEILLKNQIKWNQESFRKILDSGKTRRVNLPEPVPVLLLYFTARMGEKGQVYFFKDVYKRDEKVIKALQKPFKFVRPEDNPNS